jgi:5'-nucleotidase
VGYFVVRILVTNDDSIYSPGIAALAKSAAQFGEVTVMAPDVEQSSMGHAITASRPLSYRRSPVEFKGIEAFRVNGTPADCVALGTHLHAKTGLVMSGINMGFNLGNSMWHSGTLAAAKQAVLLGVRGIALSTWSGIKEEEFTSLEPFIEKTISILLDDEEPALFNVNFPPEPKAIKWTRQSIRYNDGKMVPGMDPMGRKHYWFTVIPLEPAEEGTDRWAVENGYVSITPLRLDLTDEKKLKEMKREQPVE